MADYMKHNEAMLFKNFHASYVSLHWQWCFTHFVPLKELEWLVSSSGMTKHTAISTWTWQILAGCPKLWTKPVLAEILGWDALISPTGQPIEPWVGDFIAVSLPQQSHGLLHHTKK
jgi:hypothetical protein